MAVLKCGWLPLFTDTLILMITCGWPPTIAPKTTARIECMRQYQVSHDRARACVRACAHVLATLTCFGNRLSDGLHKQLQTTYTIRRNC
eukprot:scaffold323216_cov24-Tisochrysis_lutea.AAC.1